MNNNIETKEITVYQRMSQVYKLTLNVPLSDEGMKIFYNSLLSLKGNNGLYSNNQGSKE